MIYFRHIGIVSLFIINTFIESFSMKGRFIDLCNHARICGYNLKLFNLLGFVIFGFKTYPVYSLSILVFKHTFKKTILSITNETDAGK